MQRDNLDLLRALEADEAAGRRRALWTSSVLVLAAAVVLAALLFSAYRQLSHVRGETERERVRLVSLRRQIDSLSPLVENYQALVAAQTPVQGGDTVPAVVDTSSIALTVDTVTTMTTTIPKDSGGPVFHPPPYEQRMRPRVYLQVVAERDRAHAQRVGRQLEARGFQVLGVEYVERAARLRNTELRYYKRADAADARRLLAALREVGEDSTALLYLGLESNTRVRPRHYEVWFAPRAGDASARGAERPPPDRSGYRPARPR